MREGDRLDEDGGRTARDGGVDVKGFCGSREGGDVHKAMVERGD